MIIKSIFLVSLIVLKSISSINSSWTLLNRIIMKSLGRIINNRRITFMKISMTIILKTNRMNYKMIETKYLNSDCGFHSLLKDMPNRWNSNYRMLRKEIKVVKNRIRRMKMKYLIRRMKMKYFIIIITIDQLWRDRNECQLQHIQ